MTTINNTYVSALLADATYVNNLSPSFNEDALRTALSPRMTPTLAAYIASEFSVVTQIETGDILGSGFDATAWRRNDGRLYVSMRGTEFGQDLFVTDVDLAFTGKARLQVVDMVNWWLRETGTDGAPVRQIRLAFPLPFGPLFEEAAPGVGTGRISAEDLLRGVEVNGHSLGGYLASAFTRLFGSQAHVVHTSTFNSAGFAFGSESAFTELENLLGVSYGLGRFPNQAEQSNYFAMNGLNFTTNSFWFSQVGQRVELFNEKDLTQLGNHYMYKLTDALALGDALARLDPTFDTGRLNTMLGAGSNQMAASIEGVFDALQRLLLGPNLGPIGVGDADGAATRTSYHATLKALTDTDTFSSLIGELTLGPLNPVGNLADGAAADFIKFITLQQLIALSVQEKTGSGALVGVLQRTYVETFGQWQADQALTQAQRDAGEESFTNQYLLDRQSMLLGLVTQNQGDLGTVQGTAIANYAYSDVGTGFAVNFRGTAANANVQPAQKVTFGDRLNNTLSGSDAEAFGVGDRLYGGAGNDIITAQAGDDYIEGNADSDSLDGGKGADKLLGGTGDDTLIGGEQADTLLGGAGNDIYILKATDGVNTDTILDAGGQGSIKVYDSSNAEISLGQGGITRVADATNLWISADKRFTYRTNAESDASITLTIGGAGISAKVLNFQDGHLGITLPGLSPAKSTPEVNAITVEGDKAPVDFDPVAAGVQSRTDEWGNVIVADGAQPDREDILYDSPGNDSLRGFGGDDLIYASRGGSDQIYGGAGIDHAELGAGEDFAEMGEGRDNARGGADNDQLYGNQWTAVQMLLDQTEAGQDDQADLLAGNAGDDSLLGGASADALFGGDGKDMLVGGAGDDHMFGDAEVSLSHNLWNIARSALIPDANGASGPFFTLEGISWSRTGAAPQADLMLGGAGSDLLTAGAGDDDLDGGADDDFVFGGTGSDTAEGGAGDDVVRGDGYGFVTSLAYALAIEHGNDLVHGGLGNDSIYGDGGNDDLYGGDGNDLVAGDAFDVDVAYHGNDTLDGGMGHDSMYGGGDEDRMDGGEGDDFLYGDLAAPDSAISTDRHGEDLLDGGAGSDQLVGDGASDTLRGGAGADHLFGDNPFVDPQFHGADYMDGGDDDDQLVGGGQGDILYGGAGNDNLFGDDDGATGDNEGADLLFGEDGNDYLQAHGGADLLAGGGGNDTLLGQAGADSIEGGAGLDLFAGGADSDTYVFSAGDTSADLSHAESVNDVEGVNHIVLYGMDIATMTLLPTTDSAVHLLQTGTDSIFIRGLKSGAIGTVRVGSISYSGNAFFGNTYVYSVSESATTQYSVVQGGKVGDNLGASGGDSTLAGGQGNDTLSASGGNNLFLYNAGDGSDVINDTSPLLDENGDPQRSTLRFGPGIEAADIRLGYVGSQLRITFGPDVAGEVLLEGFDPNNALAEAAVGMFEFDDATVLTRAQLMARGFEFTGSSANEVIIGTNLADLISGGAGNDLLAGKAGGDFYTFNIGDGADTVGDTDALLGANDTLRLGPGLEAATLEVSRSGNDLTLGVGADRVTLRNQFVNGADLIERIEFNDGTELTMSDIQAQLWLGTAGNDTVTGDSAANALFGQGGDDRLYGLEGDDTLSGGAGTDLLYGGAGDDRYLFNRGDEREILIETGGLDVIEFGADIAPDDLIGGQSGDDLWLSLVGVPGGVEVLDYFLPGTGGQRIETFQFADGTLWGLPDVVAMALRATDGNDYIEGFSLDDFIDAKAGNDLVFAGSENDTIIGGLGSDALHGQAGNDTYVFGLDAGEDLVAEDYGGLASDHDEIQYVDGIAYSDLTFKRDGNDLIMSSLTKGFSTRVAGQFAVFTNANGVERIEFADGISLDRAMLRIEAMRASNTNDTLEGGDTGDVIDGLAGDDLILGQGGNDVLSGGAGNDIVSGGPGNDLFLYEVGDGFDLISDGEIAIGFASASGGTDALVFGSGIDPASVTPTRNGDQLLLTVSAVERVQIWNYFSRGDIEQVRFADGTVWTQATIAQRLPIIGTDGADRLNGSNAADAIYGLGNAVGTIDSIYGGLGDDFLDGGAGADSLFGDGGNDTLIGGADSARKIAYRDTLTGFDGNDVLIAGNAPADMFGGKGNDVDIGAAGADSILEDASDNSRNFMFGAAGIDSIRMYGGGAGLAIGGTGADAVNGGLATGGVNSKLVLGFNKSDGADQVGLLAAGSTISIGGGATYSNLSFEVVGLNLRLKTGSSHYVELVGWYGTGAGQGKNVSTLQIVTEGTQNYSASSTDPMKNRKVQTFNFLALAAAYDAAGRPNNFSIANNLAAVRIGGSDTEIIGGVMAYQYARTGNLGTLSYAQMQAVVNDPLFGSAAQPIAAPAALAETAEATASEPMLADAEATGESAALMSLSGGAAADAGASEPLRRPLAIEARVSGDTSHASPAPAPVAVLIEATSAPTPVVSPPALADAPLPALIEIAPVSMVQIGVPSSAGGAERDGSAIGLLHASTHAESAGNADNGSGIGANSGAAALRAATASVIGQDSAPAAAPVAASYGAASELSPQAKSSPTQAAGPKNALIDQWFARDTQNDELTLLDEILHGDAGALGHGSSGVHAFGGTQTPLGRHAIAAAWTRSHAYQDALAQGFGAEISMADGADTSAWSGFGLHPGSYAMPGAMAVGPVGLQSVAGHQFKSFAGLHEGLNQLSAQ